MYNIKLILETYGELCKKLCPMNCKLCILDALKDWDNELLHLEKLQETSPSELRKMGIHTLEDLIRFVRGHEKT